jgi:predicted ArsR family transcriptional regulator
MGFDVKAGTADRFERISSDLSVRGFLTRLATVEHRFQVEYRHCPLMILLTMLITSGVYCE